MTELHDLSALEQAGAVSRREVSPVELVEHYLNRIERLDKAYGAFVTVTARDAVAQAWDVMSDPEPRGPLHGVPTAIKDLVPTAGVATSYGSRLFARTVPDVDAHVVTLLRRAGTISLGKTNTPEFGLTCYTDNDIVGPARNPWNLDVGAGGSSGGAAVAVALGLVPVAHGSDGGGSIRIPAGQCGLVGLKPSRGRVSEGPDAADVSGLSVQGPIARTVRDAAALLDALAVPMPGDSRRARPLPAGETFLAHADREPGRLRIGRYATPASGTPVDASCVAAWEHASRLLAGLGHDVVDIACPFPREIGRAFVTVWARYARSLPIADGDEHLLRPVTRAWRERARTVDAEQFAAALATMRDVAQRSVDATAGFDVVLTPTLATLPQPVEYFDEDDPDANVHRQAAFTAFTSAYNLTGQPVITLPLYWTPDELPVGVSLVGRPHDEATLIALAAQLEAAQPWRTRRPPEW